MGLAQNEMKAKPALPERVRSMEGLGVIRSINEHRLRRRAAKFHACLDHDMLHCCERCWTTPRVMNMVWPTPYQLGVWFGRFWPLFSEQRTDGTYCPQIFQPLPHALFRRLDPNS